jgi:hypothetical protein
MTLKLIISVTHHSMGKSTVTQILTAPLSSPDQKAPESERFDTPDEALARAKQLQAEAGGPDVARIIENDFRIR